MKNKLLVLVCIVMALGMVLAACQPQTVIQKVVETQIVKEVVPGQEKIVEKVVEKVITATPAPVAPAPKMPAPGELKVAALLDGTINDAGWNQNAYDGLAAIKTKYLAETAYTESVDRASMETVFEDYAARGFKVIFAHGFEFSDSAGLIAPKYPDTIFVVTHGSTDLLAKKLPNVISLQMNEEQPSYLMGMLAGGMTKTNKCVGIGGFKIPAISIPYKAFELGAKSVNPKFEWTETYIDTWTDTDKVLETNRAAIATGADCLFPLSGNVVPAYKLAQEKKVISWGYSADSNYLAPDAVPSSVITDYSVAMGLVVDNYVAGKKYSGEYWFSMKDKTVRLAPYHNWESKIPQDLKDKVQQTADKIISGDFKVPVSWTMQ